MKKILFYTFLMIFGLTALVVLLGIVQILAIKDEYLKPLTYAFLLELGVAVIAIFTKADFFDDQQKVKNKQAIAQKTDPKKISTKELLQMFDNRLLREVEELISLDLEKVSYPSHEEKEKLLIKLYASEKIARFFEHTYSSIFGSQIKALRYLNTYAGSYIPSTGIHKFYDAVKTQYERISSKYSFENWLNYLERIVLILRNKDTVCITVRGQEFLKYLVDQGLTDNKIG